MYAAHAAPASSANATPATGQLAALEAEQGDPDRGEQRPRPGRAARRLPGDRERQRAEELDGHRDARAGSGRTTRRSPSSWCRGLTPKRDRHPPVVRRTTAQRRSRDRGQHQRAGRQPQPDQGRSGRRRRTGSSRSPRRAGPTGCRRPPARPAGSSTAPRNLPTLGHLGPTVQRGAAVSRPRQRARGCAASRRRSSRGPSRRRPTGSGTARPARRRRAASRGPRAGRSAPGELGDVLLEHRARSAPARRVPDQQPQQHRVLEHREARPAISAIQLAQRRRPAVGDPVRRRTPALARRSSAGSTSPCSVSRASSE